MILRYGDVFYGFTLGYNSQSAAFRKPEAPLENRDASSALDLQRAAGRIAILFLCWDNELIFSSNNKRSKGLCSKRKGRRENPKGRHPNNTKMKGHFYPSRSSHSLIIHPVVSHLHNPICGPIHLRDLQMVDVEGWYQRHCSNGRAFPCMCRGFPRFGAGKGRVERVKGE